MEGVARHQVLRRIAASNLVLYWTTTALPLAPSDRTLSDRVSRKAGRYSVISMSGVGEASLVLGLISSTIAIIEAAREIYDAVGDPRGLPEKFRAAADQIHLVTDTLKLAEQNILAQKVDGQAVRNAMPVLERCKEIAVRIKEIFDKNIPGSDASPAERLSKAVGLKMKSKKVVEDIEELFKSMALLAQHQVFQNTAVLQKIQEASERLSNLPDDEDTSQFVHFGAGPLNVNWGPGRQQNNTNSGSGTQYIGETQHFGPPPGR